MSVYYIYIQRGGGGDEREGECVCVERECGERE